MNREDDQPLWDLLARNRAPDVSPFFVRDVVRRVRADSTDAWSFASLFKRWKLATAGTVAAALIASAFVMVLLPRHRTEQVSGNRAAVGLHDEDFARDIDDLVAANDDDNNDDDVAVL